MSAVRVIQTFVRVCADCPRCSYYSGGMYECGLTEERIRPDDKPYKIGDQCPLPYAGPPNPTPSPNMSASIPVGFTREEIAEMLSIVEMEPQTVDGGGEWGPSESTDGWYTRLLRGLLTSEEAMTTDKTLPPSQRVIGSKERQDD